MSTDFEGYNMSLPHYDILIDGNVYEGNDSLEIARQLYDTVDDTCLREYYGHKKTLQRREGNKVEILQEAKILKPFTSVRIYYSDGSQADGQIRLYPDEAIAYYLGNPWTFFNAKTGQEYTVTATKVEILNSEREVVLEGTV